MRTIGVAVAMAFAMVGLAQAASGGVKTVKNWTSVCDNIGDCAAFGFPSDEAALAYLEIRRAAGPDAAPTATISYASDDKQPSADWQLTLDGQPMAGVGSVRAARSDAGARAEMAGPEALALIDALGSGQSLEVADGSKALFSISLAGSAAVLLWVDDQQGRIGTVTAFLRKGPKPAASVPPAPPTPIIAAAAPVSQAGLADHAPKSLIKGVEDCDTKRAATGSDDIVARLAPGVVLWGPECSMAAYNESSIFFVGDEHAGHMRRIVFPKPPGSSEPSTDILVNAGFDPKTQTLSSFNKGRGLADCGVSTSWVWNGKAFALLSENIMPVCQGVGADDWPPLFVGRRK